MINYIFLVITQRVVFIGRRFGTSCWLHTLGYLTSPAEYSPPTLFFLYNTHPNAIPVFSSTQKMEQQVVPKHRPVNVTRRAVTRKLELIYGGSFTYRHPSELLPLK